MATSITESGFLRIDLDVSVSGPLNKDEAEKIKVELLKFFKENKYNVKGKMKYISISTLEVEHSYTNLDTSSR